MTLGMTPLPQVTASGRGNVFRQPAINRMDNTKMDVRGCAMNSAAVNVQTLLLGGQV